MPRTTILHLRRRYRFYIGIFLIVGLVVLSVFYLTRRPARLGPNDYATPIAHAYALMYAGTGVAGKMTDSSGATLTTFEFQPADRLHITTTAGSAKTESIWAGGTFYTRANSDKWRRATIIPTSQGTNLLPVVAVDQLGALSGHEKDKSVFSKGVATACPAENRQCAIYNEALADKQTRVYYIDTVTGRLFRIDQLFEKTVTLTTRYEYKPVSIVLPTDAETDTAPISSAQPSVPPDVIKSFQQNQQRAQ